MDVSTYLMQTELSSVIDEDGLDRRTVTGAETQWTLPSSTRISTARRHSSLAWVSEMISQR
jgi:hypothetical protein